MYRLNLYILSGLILLTSACTKSDFLGKKPNTNIVIPSTLDDMTQLLDDQDAMIANSPTLGIISSDEYYYPTFDQYNSAPTQTEKNAYIWNKDLYQGAQSVQDWNAPYKAVFYANVVLSQWELLTDVDKSSSNGRFVKAWALFERGYNFFDLVQTFAKPYVQSTANSDLGIPIKLSADINSISPRSTLQQSYDQLLTDIKTSINLFSTNSPGKYNNRPSKSAAYALLARIYLNMRDYQRAKLYADSTLMIYHSLLDYNTIDITSSNPFDLTNKEVLCMSIGITSYYASVVGFGPCQIDTSLINLYEADDLRRYLFFREDKGFHYMKVGYNGFGYYPFTGLAVDEILLIRAECLARANMLLPALADLNTLLVNRYHKDTFVPFNSSIQSIVLNKILEERRKELVWRGLRWQDIKRLNLEGANITLKRIIGAETFTLPPNDARYVMPIPDDEIALSHIKQNER